MKKIIYLALLFSFLLLPITAQTKKNKKKNLPVKAVVTIKIDKVPEVKPPFEEDVGIWNEYSSKKYNFKITFPSKLADIRDDETGEIGTFETVTNESSYELIVKILPLVVNKSHLEEFYEASFYKILSDRNIKLTSKTNVYLNGRLGREFVYTDKDKIYFQRLYILDGKLFALSVILPEKQYNKNFDRWALKFFESFKVEVRDNSIF